MQFNHPLTLWGQWMSPPWRCLCHEIVSYFGHNLPKSISALAVIDCYLNILTQCLIRMWSKRISIPKREIDHPRHRRSKIIILLTRLCYNKTKTTEWHHEQKRQPNTSVSFGVWWVRATSLTYPLTLGLGLSITWMGPFIFHAKPTLVQEMK